MRLLFCVLSSVFWVLCSGCASSPAKPERPANTNIEITRPTIQAKMIAVTDVTIRSGRVPLLALKDGDTRFGNLEPGKYVLTAVSADPYRMSDYADATWQSRPFELVIEKDKFYRLEIGPAAGQGWEIRQIPEE